MKKKVDKIQELKKNGEYNRLLEKVKKMDWKEWEEQDNLRAVYKHQKWCTLKQYETIK